MSDENDNIEDKDEQDKEQFSSDPEEQLRIENELLRLKLQAETGADLHQLKDVPPEVENAFLNNILAFERQLDQVEEVSIFKIIGEPSDFRPDAELSDAQIDQELLRLNDLLEANHIEVGYGMEYSPRIKYKFITEELFEHETQKFDIPDMVHHFVYEEFHPNHKLTIEGITEEFLDMWLARNMDTESFIFGDTMVSTHGNILTKSEFFQKIQHVFDAFLEFNEGHYKITDISFDLKEDSNESEEADGLGFAEGLIRYDAILETNEVEEIKAPFKLYFCFKYGYWEIMNIIMPGITL